MAKKSKSLAGQYSKVLRASYISTIDIEIKCELEMTKLGITRIKMLINRLYPLQSTFKQIFSLFRTVLVNGGASFRWSFVPHFAWDSIESTTILTTYPSLQLGIGRNGVSHW